MVLVLLIGDMHIPHRAGALPQAFKSLLVPGRIQHVLCTGDLCNRETLDYLRYLCPDVHVTRGVFDDVNLAGGSASVALPERKVVSIAGWRIGLSHGHDVVPAGDLEAAAALQRQMDCDVLVLGNTHAFKLFKYEDRYIINPGSATGAFSATANTSKPSFVLMNIENAAGGSNGHGSEGSAKLFVYEIDEAGEVKISEVQISK